jgi:hypothetical protein
VLVLAALLHVSRLYYRYNRKLILIRITRK